MKKWIMIVSIFVVCLAILNVEYENGRFYYRYTNFYFYFDLMFNKDILEPIMMENYDFSKEGNVKTYIIVFPSYYKYCVYLYSPKQSIPE